MANEKLSQKAAATTPLTGAELLYAVQDGVSVSVTVDDVAARASGAVQGADGASAYEVAVANGFVGTEPEWLLSLVGADSTVPGPQGEHGLQGIQGEVGPAGADSVVPGPQGEQGLAGEAGAGLNILGSYATLIDLQAAHQTGATGDAYLIAGDLYVWDGAWSNVGNIQGPQGIQGIQGLTGEQGLPGADGADSTVAGPQGLTGETGPAGVGVPVGGTAGQVLAKVDATDYSSEWVDQAEGGGLTNPMTTAGDIIIGGVSGAPERLAKGTDGQVLTVVAGVPAYAAAGGGSATIDWTSPVVVTDTANLAYGKHYIVAVTAADKTLTLPEITATDYGKMIVVEIAAATTKLITIDGYATQVIDGVTTRIMWASEVAQLVATVNGWTKVGGKSIPFSATMRLSANQIISALAWSKVNIDSIDLANFAGMCDITNKQITAPRNGLFLLDGTLVYPSTNVTACLIYCGLYINGVAVVAPSASRAASTTLGITATSTAELSAGSLVSMYGYFSAGSFSPSTFAVGPTYNKLSAVEVPQW